METTAHLDQLLALAEALAGGGTGPAVAAAALPTLRRVAGAEAALVVHVAEPTDASGAWQVASQDGSSLPVEDLERLDGAGRAQTEMSVPESWRTRGIRRVTATELPGQVGVLVLAWAQSADSSSPALELGLTQLEAAVGRSVAEADLAELAARVDNAQQLANMGDYDWHIPTDTNRWSDQLYRIYGHEPQSFNASYERFLSLVHPDDRERVQALHRRAYGSGEPWQVVERIIRPDGDVRHLLTNGEVVMGPDAVPVRMRGTCIDITDRVHADAEKAQMAARFQSLVDSAPDAILVLDRDEHIQGSNPQARRLLGGAPEGHGIGEILPTWPDAPTTAAPARALDGRELLLDVTTARVNDEDGSTGDSFVALYLLDAEPRLAQAALATRLGEVRLRRRQALEINDNVVQGLVTVAYALDQGQVSASQRYLEQTLSSARAMMDDLLEPLEGEDLQPGDLVRTSPAVVGPPPDAAPVQEAGHSGLAPSRRVLVVDDAEDLRMLLRARMETRPGLVVVGEAADGIAAVEMAAELQPDLVMLDLAMPRMDGLEALPLIRAAVPGVRVIVLSGFNQGTLAEKAIEAGADRYVVKGGSMAELLELVDSVLELMAP